MLITPAVDPGPCDSEAVSFCLFQSPALRPDKHLAPLETFLCEQKLTGLFQPDVLLFIEGDLPVKIPEGEGIRVFQVGGFTGWHRHLYRYAPASDPKLFPYKWVRFAGTDTPRQPWLEQLLPICKAHDIPVASSLRSFACAGDYVFSGSCFLRHNLFGSLWGEIIGRRDDLRDLWNADEYLLCRWFLREKLPVVWHTRSLVNCRVQKLLLDRLYQGPKTILVAEPTRSSGYYGGGFNL